MGDLGSWRGCGRRARVHSLSATDFFTRKQRRQVPKDEVKRKEQREGLRPSNRISVLLLRQLWCRQEEAP